MRLVTFSPVSSIHETRVGIMLEGYVIDANLGYAGVLHSRGSDSPYREADLILPREMLRFLERGRAAMEAAEGLLRLAKSRKAVSGPMGERAVFHLSEVKLHPPLPRPLGIRDFMCFRTHMENTFRRLGQEIPEIWVSIPAYYRANPLNVIGPGDEVLWPSLTDKLDYEFEIAMYIGRMGRDIDSSEAQDYIAGFSILNDISARDRQAPQMQVGLGPGKGKDFDTAKILGPCIATPDEVDFKKMRCVIRINGEVVMEGDTSDMHWSWGDLIEYVSQDETIYPGEVFGSGTIGYGCALENGRWLKPGDIVELEAEGIGVLSNRIVRRTEHRLWRNRY